ncbi:LysR family transcriptional regulator [Pseudorhodoferax sp. LjRoot39]|uniref:LysR family transcriptional regulator n=1 Tax=Pseudorhodoferax sp. LjRoot39 TaxID=3342328 RepID=UPI003ECE089E
MELRQLRQFVTVAETRSLRRAAERLHMAQPPLSVAMRKLEEDMGVALFERSARGVQLTSAGEGALAAARKCLAAAAEVGAAARAVAGGETGELRIGFTGSTTFGLLPRMVRAFHQRYPQVRLHLHELTNQQSLTQVQAGQVDLAFVRVPTSHLPGLHFEVMERDRFCVALPPGHALAAKARLTLRDLAGQDFIGYTPSPVGGLHAASSRLLQQAEVAVQLVQEAVQVSTVLGLVLSGLGLALVPSTNAHYYATSVVYRPLRGLSRDSGIGIALVHRPDSGNPATAHFAASAAQLAAGDVEA